MPGCIQGSLSSKSSWSFSTPALMNLIMLSFFHQIVPPFHPCELCSPAESGIPSSGAQDGVSLRSLRPETSEASVRSLDRGLSALRPLGSSSSSTRESVPPSHTQLHQLGCMGDGLGRCEDADDRALRGMQSFGRLGHYILGNSQRLSFFTPQFDSPTP